MPRQVIYHRAVGGLSPTRCLLALLAVLIVPGSALAQEERGAVSCDMRCAARALDADPALSVYIDEAIRDVGPSPDAQPAPERAEEADWRFWATIGGGLALVAVLVVVIAAAAASGSQASETVGDYDPAVLRW
jgi:hypothetical protein